MASTFSSLKFLSLHRVLLSRMLILDSILGVLGSVFLLVPLHNYALSLDNLSLLVLFVLSTVVYQIHLFRTYTGGATFYLNLPVEKHRLLIMLFIEALIPLVVALSITAIVLAFSNILQLVHISMQAAILQRAYYMVLTLFVLKTVALPVLVLYKKHIVLTVLFPGLLVCVYMLISIATEFMHIPDVFFGFFFVAGVEAICVKIIMSAKIN